MSLFVVDVEADGQVPHLYSMVCFGVVKVDSKLDKTFYGETAPISQKHIPEALAVSGFKREEHLLFDHPYDVMVRFKAWLDENSVGKPVFISDNLAFDWQWINYYFHLYLQKNPFGFSGRRIGDIYCGMKMNAGKNHEWKKKYRKTKHDHNPVNDAMGNAQAILAFQKNGLKINLN